MTDETYLGSEPAVFLDARECDMSTECGFAADRVVTIRYARPGRPTETRGRSLCSSCREELLLGGAIDDWMARTEFQYAIRQSGESLPTQADVIAREEGIRRYADGQSLAISFYDQGD